MDNSGSDGQKITPYLWFDNQAEEAADFYTSIFEDGKIENVTRYGEAGAGASGIRAGSVMTVTFRIEGVAFVALNGGPTFHFTPAISFVVACDGHEKIDSLWAKLAEGGEVLMPLDKYPFAEKFGWINDRFGVSWQLNLTSSRQKITPSLMFVGDQHGRAEEAVKLYTSVFPDATVDRMVRYGEGEGAPVGTVKQASFSLEGEAFMVMDSHLEHAFAFTEATSFLVDCETQAEVDELWALLSEGGEEGQCGWLKDRFGVSWQIVPSELMQMLADRDLAKAEAVMRAMLKMKKIDIERLREVYEQS